MTLITGCEYFPGGLGGFTADKNEFLQFNSDTGQYDFVYDANINLANYPSVAAAGGGGGFVYQLIIALKQPITILKNSKVNAHFVPQNVSFGTASGSTNTQTTKRPITATSLLSLENLKATAHTWNGCVCCPFYSFALEETLGSSVVQRDYISIKYLAIDGFLGGCNGKPNYFARLQSISITLPEVKPPTPTPTIIETCVDTEHCDNVSLDIQSTNKTIFELVQDASLNDFKFKLI